MYKKIRQAGYNFNFMPYSSHVNNMSDLEDTNELEKILKNIELISAKNEYENNLHYSLSYNQEKNYYYRFDGFDVDILNTNFNDIDNLKNTLDSTYKCNIEKTKIEKLEINDITDIVTKVFFYSDYIDEKEKDIIKLKINKLIENLGNFVDLYEIHDDKINNFYIDMGVYCIVFEKHSLVIKFGNYE